MQVLESLGRSETEAELTLGLDDAALAGIATTPTPAPADASGAGAPLAATSVRSDASRPWPLGGGLGAQLLLAAVGTAALLWL